MSLWNSLFGDEKNPNRKLEGLIRELAKAEDPELKAAFYKELASCSLRLASPGSVGSGRLAEGAAVAGDSTTIPFVATRDDKGGKVMLAFTGEEALLAWRPVGCDTVELKIKDLCALALSAGVASVAINPRGPVGGLLRTDEIKALAQGRAPAVFGQKTAAPQCLALRAPSAVPPPALVQALAVSARAEPWIAAVYLAEADIDGEASLVTCLDLKEGGKAEAVIPGFLDRLAESLKGGRVPDALPLPKTGELREAALRDGIRIYTAA